MTEAMKVPMDSDLAGVWRETDANLRRLIPRVQGYASGQELRDIYSLIDANEFGEAFELICFILSKRMPEVPAYLSFELNRAASVMNIPTTSLPVRLRGRPV